MHKLATYIANARRRPLPAAVTERAKHHLLDTIAAMLSGSRLLPGRRAIEFVATQGGVSESTVIGSTLVTSAINAALANGMHAHADETDDTYYLALVHPGCGVVPAALALAERERSTGTELLRAVVLGYDICARMSIALGIERFRERGHSTHSFGHMFGAAAAAAPDEPREGAGLDRSRDAAGLRRPHRRLNLFKASSARRPVRCAGRSARPAAHRA